MANTAPKEKSSWAILPRDLLLSILETLDFQDSLSFAAVCKHWRSIFISTGICRRKIEPCLVFTRQVSATNGLLYLFIPSKSRILKIPIAAGSSPAMVIGSCKSWLLLSPASSGNSFFFHPFSKSRLDIPATSGEIQFATMTASPESDGCVVLAVQKRRYATSELKICRPGDVKWAHTYSLGGYAERFGEVREVVFSEGRLYCMDSKGRVGGFNVARRDWEAIAIKSLPWKSTERHESSKYLVESNGEILLVLKTKALQVAVLAGARFRWTEFRVFRLNFSERNWTEIKDLGDRNLFIGKNCSRSFPITGQKRRSLIYFTDFDGYGNEFNCCCYTGLWCCQLRSGISWKEMEIQSIVRPVWIEPQPWMN